VCVHSTVAKTSLMLTWYNMCKIIGSWSVSRMSNTIPDSQTFRWTTGYRWLNDIKRQMWILNRQLLRRKWSMCIQRCNHNSLEKKIR
jgi:hypothetical protein